MEPPTKRRRYGGAVEGTLDSSDVDPNEAVSGVASTVTPSGHPPPKPCAISNSRATEPKPRETTTSREEMDENDAPPPFRGDRGMESDSLFVEDEHPRAPSAATASLLTKKTIVQGREQLQPMTQSLATTTPTPEKSSQTHHRPKSEPEKADPQKDLYAIPVRSPLANVPSLPPNPRKDAPLHARATSSPKRSRTNQPPPPPTDSPNTKDAAEDRREASSVAFLAEDLEALVGQKIPTTTLDIIRAHCDDSLEKAVNMYYDGTWMRYKKATPLRKKSRSTSPKKLRPQTKTTPASTTPTSTTITTTTTTSTSPTTSFSSVVSGQASSVNDARYIGVFGVEGWATRSGTNVLRYGEKVKIERQKIQQSSTSTSAASSTKTATKTTKTTTTTTTTASGRGGVGRLAASRRVDVIVRFTTLSGREVGRLAKDTANWVSTLLDQGICLLEGSCVYAPERIRTNDTIFLQLRVSLLSSAFHKPKHGANAASTTLQSFSEQVETVEEKNLRLRQVALVRLFTEVNLEPTTLNSAHVKQQRQNLLQAAEVDEKKTTKPSSSSSSTTSSVSSPVASSPAATPSSAVDEAEDGQELEQDQLDALYRKAQSFDFATPLAEPADTFSMSLRDYQKQALHWMLSKERDTDSDDSREASLHPLWEEYTWPEKDADNVTIDVPATAPSRFYMNPYSGELSLDFPAQKQHCLGGILADEMGLGKTIQMLSLIHTHRTPRPPPPPPPSPSLQEDDDRPSSVANLPPARRLHLTRSGLPSRSMVRAPYTTLVIAPMSLLAQWQSEVEKASKEGTCTSLVYYGAEKNVNVQALCGEENGRHAPDVLITSYGVILSEFNQMTASLSSSSSSSSSSASPPPLPAQSSYSGIFQVRFFRIILDEGHVIKNRSSKTSKACYQLEADHRWVLTGTPIVNRLEDLFSLVRFLGVEPWNHFSFWRTFITLPFESRDFMRALDVVQTVLEPLVMRRTKSMTTPDGRPLVPLPPKKIEFVPVVLSPPEREIYDYIFTKAQNSFRDNVQAGTVMKAYTNIFAQILRLRQTCCHPTLVRNRDIVAEEEEESAAIDQSTGFSDDMDLDVLLNRFKSSTEDGDGPGSRTNAVFGAHVLEEIRKDSRNECPICAEEPMVDQIVTACLHSCCKQCLLDYMKHESDRGRSPRCVHCRQPINARDLFEVIRHDDSDEEEEDDDDDDKDTDTVQDDGKKGTDVTKKEKEKNEATQPTLPWKTKEISAADSGHVPKKISLQRMGVNDSSSKIVALIEHLRALRTKDRTMKSVVFSQFTSFLTLIEAALDRARIRHLRLDGTMAQKARAAVLAEFLAARKFTVLLISLRAGGVGLNLTSAKRVYLMDPWWSFAVEAQAIDRVHRMGQDAEVEVYRFIVEGSVEQRMLRVQERKMFIASSLGMMSDEEKKHQRIEDIRELLS